MTIDSISDMATIIRNAIMIKNSVVSLPYTKNNEIIAKILAKEGFIHCVTTTNKTNTTDLGVSQWENSRETKLKSTDINPNEAHEKTESSHDMGNSVFSPVSSKLKQSSESQKVIILALKYVGREKKTMIHAIKRISKPSLRWYSQSPIPQSLGGLGIFIVSTSFGILTDKEAWDKKLGGEILLEIW